MNYSTEQQAFIGARIAQAKRAILCSVLTCTLLGSEIVPLACKSFSRLHDFCDANELGGLCDDAITEEGNRLFPERLDAETLATQEWMEATNDVQNAVHSWLETGGMVDDAAFIAKTLDEEQICCLMDDGRAEEALAMVDEDIGHRMAHLFAPETVARLRAFLSPAA
jgi:hypothetical protein